MVAGTKTLPKAHGWSVTNAPNRGAPIHWPAGLSAGWFIGATIQRKKNRIDQNQNRRVRFVEDRNRLSTRKEQSVHALPQSKRLCFVVSED